MTELQQRRVSVSEQRSTQNSEQSFGDFNLDFPPSRRSRPSDRHDSDGHLSSAARGPTEKIPVLSSVEMGTPTAPHLDQHILVGAHLLGRGHKWISEAGDNHTLVFRPDGTGEMVSQADGVIALVAGIDWRIVPSAGLSKQHGTRPVPIPVILRSGPILQPPQTAFEGTLEIAMNPQRPLLDGKVVNYRLIDDKLLPTAFQPRKIPFIVESGEFYLPRARTFYGLRMTFNPSPYPLRETWRTEERVMVETMKLCEMTQFCARPLARKIDPAEEGSRGGCVLM